MIRTILIAAIGSSIVGCSVPTCSTGEEDCYDVSTGRYYAFSPDDGPGDEGYKLLLYFHGYGSSASKTSKKPWLRREANRRGYLLVLPDGLDNTWAHQGSPSRARDEPAFVDDIMEDVLSRWDIADTRVVGGFSQGGSMAWDVACYRGEIFSAFIPASGGFWEPLPEVCASPVSLRHTHGTADTVVPMTGRPIGSSHQGDIETGFARWRAANGCAPEPDAVVTEGTETCAVWTACSVGKELKLCTHPGKHTKPDGFLPRALEWAETQ